MWEREIQSACSEMCVARFLNRYWEGGTFGQGSPSATDAGGHQVRWTAHPTGHLIVERSAPLDHNYVLVTGKTPSFILRGYLHLAFLWDEGSEHKWWRGDSWWVPQGELKDCADLRDENTKPNPKNQ